MISLFEDNLLHASVENNRWSLGAKSGEYGVLTTAARGQFRSNFSHYYLIVTCNLEMKLLIFNPFKTAYHI